MVPVRFKVKDLEASLGIEKEDIIMLANLFNALKREWGNDVKMEIINE